MEQLETKSATKRGLIGVIWHFVTTFFTSILQILFIAVLARLLEPQEFGYMAFIMILTGFSDLFSQMGIGGSLIQMTKISSKHINQGYNLALGLGVLISLILYLTTPIIVTVFNMEVIKTGVLVFTLFIPLSSVNSVSKALLLREYKFPVLEKIGLFCFLIGNGIIPIVLAYFGYGYWSLLIGQFTSIIIATVLLSYHAPIRFSLSWHKKEANELLFFGGGHTLGIVFNYFAENADNIVISKYTNAVGLGLYSKGFQLFAIPAKIFGGIFDKIMFPILSQRKSNLDKLKNFYLFCISSCFIFLFPMALLININAVMIVEIILGEGWQAVSSLLQILIIGLAFRFASKINKSFLKSLGLVYKGALYQFVFFLIISLACFIGVKVNGLNGVTYGVLVSTVLNFSLVFFIMCSILGIKRKQYMKVVTLLILFLLPLSFSLPIISTMNVKSGAYLLLVSLTIYLAVLLFTISHKKSVLYLIKENNELMTQIIDNLPYKIKTFLRKKNLVKA